MSKLLVTLAILTLSFCLSSADRGERVVRIDGKRMKLVDAHHHQTGKDFNVANSSMEPTYIGSLIAVGCTQGAIGGIGKFKTTTGTLSKEEIKAVLLAMQGQVNQLKEELNFKSDPASQLAAWDFQTQAMLLTVTIDDAFRSTKTLELQSLNRLHRRIEPMFRVFFRNFNEAHHVGFLTGGRDPCGSAGVSNCENAVARPPKSFLAAFQTARRVEGASWTASFLAYEKPCEQGELEGRRGTRKACLLKRSLMVMPWRDALTTPVCAGDASDNGKTCLLAPGADGEVSSLAESIVQAKFCQAGNVATPEEALEKMRKQDAQIFGLIDNNQMLDAISTMRFSGAAALAIQDTAVTAAQEEVSAIRTSKAFNHNVFADFAVSKASAMVCQLAVAQVLHSCPDLVQQVVVNAVQPIFSAAGQVLAAGVDLMSRASLLFGFGGSSAAEKDSAEILDTNRQTCNEATEAVDVEQKGLVSSDQMEVLDDIVTEIEEANEGDTSHEEADTSPSSGSDEAAGEEDQDSPCTSLKGKRSLYSTKFKLGACQSKVFVFAYQRGSEIIGLKPNRKSHKVNCSELNPEFEGEFYVRCYEDGPDRYQGYRRLKSYMKRCKAKRGKTISKTCPARGGRSIHTLSQSNRGTPWVTLGIVPHG